MTTALEMTNFLNLSMQDKVDKYFELKEDFEDAECTIRNLNQDKGALKIEIEILKTN